MQDLYRVANTLMPGLFDSKVKRKIRERMRRPFAAAVLGLLKETLLAASTPISFLRFRALSNKKNLKLHLGCGSDIRAGWINIDMYLAPWGPATPDSNGNSTVIRHDLRRGLPLEKESCDFIYSSHFFEHLEYEHGLRLMQDCYRILRPGGIFRLALPNFKALFNAYLREDKEYFELIDIFEALPAVESGTNTLLDYVNYGAYQNGEHRCMYDEEKLILVLKRIGFSSVVPSSYRAGIDPVDPVRQRYSFYLEATK